MKNITSIFFAVILLVSCTTPTTSVAPPSPSESLVELFKIANDSTLHFFNSEKEIENPLPDSLLENVLSEEIIETMEYGTGDAQHQANQQFHLDEKHLACIVYSTENWYKNQSLLIYDEETKDFKNAMTVSQFYGGDGGQIVTESYIYTENSTKYLYQIESSHAIIPSNGSDELEEMLEEHRQLYVWKGNAFETIAQQDSLALAQQFQLKWEW